MAQKVIIREQQAAGDSGMGFFMAVVLLIGVAVAIWYWGIPAVRNTGVTNVQVPSEIDVNINQEGSGE